MQEIQNAFIALGIHAQFRKNAKLDDFFITIKREQKNDIKNLSVEDINRLAGVK